MLPRLLRKIPLVKDLEPFKKMHQSQDLNLLGQLKFVEIPKNIAKERELLITLLM